MPASERPPPDDRAAAFHREMSRLYARSENEIGYRPTAFRAMVADVGGVEAARRLVMAAQPSDGFALLWEKRRLDLSAEAYVVAERFAGLFEDDVVERARARLADYGFDT